MNQRSCMRNRKPRTPIPDCLIGDEDHEDDDGRELAERRRAAWAAFRKADVGGSGVRDATAPGEPDDTGGRKPRALPPKPPSMGKVVPHPALSIPTPSATVADQPPSRTDPTRPVVDEIEEGDDVDDDEWLEADERGITVQELREEKQQIREQQALNAAAAERPARVRQQRYPEHDEQGEGEYDWETPAPPHRPLKVTQVKLDPLFPLVDVDRFAQLRLIGSRAAAAGAAATHDLDPDDGLPCRIWRVGGQCVGVAAVPDHELYAPRSRAKLAALVEDGEGLGDVEVRQRLDGRANALRPGVLMERLLWAVHHRVTAMAQSEVLVPHKWLATALWGPGRPPDNWRRDLDRTVHSALVLHAARGLVRPFGAETALLLGAEDVGERCDGSCPWHGGKPHTHVRVRTAAAFLGCLADFGSSQTPRGERRFAFYQTATGGDGNVPSLRAMGKEGKLRAVFLPAMLGERGMCQRLGPLVNSLVRETTRRNSRKARGNDVVKGNRVPGFSGGIALDCPLLPEGGRHVGFNGNGRKRRGLGFLLATRANKLAECERPWMTTHAGDVQHLLDRLAEAEEALGVIVAAIDPEPEGGKQWLSLADLRAASPRVQARVHVRIYTEKNFVTRWARAFGWAGDRPKPASPPPPPGADAERFRKAATAAKLSVKQLANEAGISPSMMRLVLAGKRTMTTKVATFLRRRLLGREVRRAIGGPGSGDVFAGAQTMCDFALAYRKLGIAIIPMAKPSPGTVSKPAAVRWKEWQTSLPSRGQIRDWWATWRKAGIAAVLGPHSGLSAIDVDGEEADRVLHERVPAEVLAAAPKVFSGSGDPHRYHLWFQCPDLPDGAANVITPWFRKLEFRCHVSLLVCPPSPHKSGNKYRWAEGRGLTDLVVPPFPIEVLAAIEEEAAFSEARRAAVPVLPPLDVAAASAGLPPLHRLTTRYLEGEWAFASYWNDRLFLAACDMNGRGVLRSVAEPLLLAGARPVSQSDLSPAVATIASAYSKPRYPHQ